MLFAVEYYDTGDFTLPDEPARRTEHSDFIEAMGQFITLAMEYYRPDKMKLRDTDDNGLPPRSIALFESGQPGNVVLRGEWEWEDEANNVNNGP